MDSITSFLDNIKLRYVFALFLLLGLVIYGNSLFNSFIADDVPQIQKNVSIRSVRNIPRLFSQGTFYFGDIGEKDKQNYYKPIFSSAYALIYAVSGDSPFGYHLFQVIIHIVNAILVFWILSQFFGKRLSTLLGLIFLTHPINTESVVYIATLQEPLFLFFGLLAICTELKGGKDPYRSLLITLFLTLSMLTKESAIVFLIIVPLFDFLYRKKNPLLTLVPSAIALCVYILMRFAVAKIYFPQSAIVPIMTLSFWDRLVHIPKIIFFYFSTFVFPLDLFALQSWTINKLNLQNFYLPLLFVLVLFSALAMFIVKAFKRNRTLFKGLLFFSIWLCIGLGVHLQLVPLDQTVSDHWFYFPMIGLLGILGCLYEYLDIDIRVKPKITIAVLLVIVALLGVRTIIRNENWRNSMVLAEHDLKYGPDSHQLEKLLANAYLTNHDYSEAEYHFIRAVNLFPNVNTLTALGAYYAKVERYQDALKAFERILSFDDSDVQTWTALAAVKTNLGDKEGALEAAKKAYSISPSESTLRILNFIQQGDKIKIQ